MHRPHVAKKRSSKVMKDPNKNNKKDCSENVNSQDESKENINNPNDNRTNYTNPGEIFKNKNIDQSDIDDIPSSVFESSSDSESSNSFKSVEPEEIKESSKVHLNPMKVEYFSDESLNAGEDVMVSLSDIPIEIDQGLSDADKNTPNDYQHRDNGRKSKYDKNILKNEQEVKLNDEYTEMASVHNKKEVKIIQS